MHKFCLTEPECDRIQGAQKIIETLVFFPSMENTIIEEIYIKNTYRLGLRYEVSLLFDLSCGGKREVKGGKSKIRMTFYGIRDVHIDTDAFIWPYCSGIKFSNRFDLENVQQDNVPSTTPIIPPPFTGFIIGRGKDFYLEFYDEEYTVDAFFED